MRSATCLTSGPAFGKLNVTDKLLALTVLVIVGTTVWLLATNQVTPEERDAMLRDEEMWP